MMILFFIPQILVQTDQGIKPSNSKSLKPTVASTIIRNSVPSVGPSGVPNCFSVPSLKPSHLPNTLLSLSINGTHSLETSYGLSVNQSGSISLVPSAIPSGFVARNFDPSVSSICLVQKHVHSLRNESTIHLTSSTSTLFWRRTLFGSMKVAC